MKYIKDFYKENDIYLKIDSLDTSLENGLENLNLLNDPILYVELYRFAYSNYEISFPFIKKENFFFFKFDKRIYSFKADRNNLKTKY